MGSTNEDVTLVEESTVLETVNKACEPASDRLSSCEDDPNDVCLPPPLPAKSVIHLRLARNSGEPAGSNRVDDDARENQEVEEVEGEMEVEDEGREGKITTACAPIVFGNKSTSSVTMQLSTSVGYSDVESGPNNNGATTKANVNTDLQIQGKAFVTKPVPQIQPRVGSGCTAPNHLPFNLCGPLPYSKKLKTNGKTQFAMAKKLSTFSLAASVEKDRQNRAPEIHQSAIQRRNSIHNVPYVDVNDPQTRARMERYKEERRNMLREKYKVEDYFVEKFPDADVPKSQPGAVLLKKMSVGGETDKRPQSLSGPCRKARATARVSCPPVTPGTPSDIGLVEDDVNVKERAAIFDSKAEVPTTWKNRNWKGERKTSAPVLGSKDDPVTNRRPSVGTSTSPNKIKNIAAFFEQNT